MAKSDLLNFLKDINYVYNDCGMHDCVSKMLDDFEAEIRAKAIEEFAKALLTNKVVDKSVVRRVAEQLKEE